MEKILIMDEQNYALDLEEMLYTLGEALEKNRIMLEKRRNAGLESTRIQDITANKGLFSKIRE